MKQNYKASLYILLSLLTILSLLYMKKEYDYKIINTLNKSMEEVYNEKTKELDKKLKITNEEQRKLQDSYYEEMLIKLLGKEKLTVIAKENYKYSIYVNNMEIKEDQVNINSKDILIILEEKEIKESNLPSEIEKWGSITGGDISDKFYDYLSVKADILYDMQVKHLENEKSTQVYYIFKDVPRGTIITLKISEVLSERLKITNNIIEILVPS